MIDLIPKTPLGDSHPEVVFASPTAYTLFGLRMTHAELDYQLANYGKLRLHQSPRGLAVIFLLLSVVFTAVALIYSHAALQPVILFGVLAELAVYVVCLWFIHRGQRWAMRTVAILWTIDRLVMSLASPSAWFINVFTWVIIEKPLLNAIQVERAHAGLPLVPSRHQWGRVAAFVGVQVVIDIVVSVIWPYHSTGIAVRDSLVILGYTLASLPLPLIVFRKWFVGPFGRDVGVINAVCQLLTTVAAMAMKIQGFTIVDLLAYPVLVFLIPVVFQNFAVKNEKSPV